MLIPTPRTTVSFNKMGCLACGHIASDAGPVGLRNLLTVFRIWPLATAALMLVFGMLQGFGYDLLRASRTVLDQPSGAPIFGIVPGRASDDGP